MFYSVDVSSIVSFTVAFVIRNPCLVVRAELTLVFSKEKRTSCPPVLFRPLTSAVNWDAHASMLYLHTFVYIRPHPYSHTVQPQTCKCDPKRTYHGIYNMYIHGWMSRPETYAPQMQTFVCACKHLCAHTHAPRMKSHFHKHGYTTVHLQARKM